MHVFRKFALMQVLFLTGMVYVVFIAGPLISAVFSTGVSLLREWASLCAKLVGLLLHAVGLTGHYT
jgi:hypothetical protein